MREEMHEAIERDRKARELPAVAGMMEKSIADHERACLALIDAEQYKISPDTYTIATLADSVRLGREYVASIGKQSTTDPRLDEAWESTAKAVQNELALNQEFLREAKARIVELESDPKLAELIAAIEQQAWMIEHADLAGLTEQEAMECSLNLAKPIRSALANYRASRALVEREQSHV